MASFKWSRSRRNVESPEAQGTVPASAMIPQNRNFARNARINDPQGVEIQTPTRSTDAARRWKRASQESRAPKSKPIDGFAYRIKVQNPVQKAIEIVFWEYQFLRSCESGSRGAATVSLRCEHRRGKEQDLEGFSLSGPSDVVNVKTLEGTLQYRSKKSVLINRVEYADGTIWQRKTGILPK